MKDLTLDIENNSLVWENGDLKLTNGLAMIKQHILTALYTLKGDWLLDDTKGIDVPRGMREEAFLKNDVKNAILGVNGVNKIKVFKFYREGLNIKIFAQILTELGDIELSEVVSQ